MSMSGLKNHNKEHDQRVKKLLRGVFKMISKREYFEICPNATEQDYKAFCEQMADIQDKMWEQDHPLDD